MAIATGTRRSSSSRRERPWVMTAAALVLCASLAACGRSGHTDLDWVKSAVVRNSSLELLSVDSTTDTLTVRVRTTGEIRRVRADDLIAALPGTGAGISSAAPGSAAAAPAEASTAAPAPLPPASSPPAPVTSAATEPAAPAQTSAAVSGSAPGSDIQSEAQTAAAPGALAANESTRASITRASADAPVADASVAEPDAHKVVSGPGYSIAVVGAAGPAVSREPIARNVPVEHRHEPIVCQGGRLMHIDNRNLEFDGDALAAEDGCDLHITNSRIAAQGIGVLARAARVHIENSAIEGETSSIEESAGAQVYVQSSTFKGVIRRVDSADFHDLGGNVGN